MRRKSLQYLESRTGGNKGKQKLLKKKRPTRKLLQTEKDGH